MEPTRIALWPTSAATWRTSLKKGSEAPPLEVRWLGRLAYAPAMALMEELVAARQRGQGRDTLLLLEHTPVITLGRLAQTRDIRASPDELERRGIELWPSTRGGQVTYHGPGQLVAYPVVRLEGERQDIHRYLRDLEEALIRLASGYGVAAHRLPGRTGVWVGTDKLASIGIRVSRWVTSHGVALNVARDLSGFDLIVPCGLQDAGVTSLGRLLGREPPLEEVAGRLATEMARVLGRSLQVASSGPVAWARPPSPSGASSDSRTF